MKLQAPWQWQRSWTPLILVWVGAFFLLYLLLARHLLPVVTDSEYEIFGIDAEDAEFMMRQLTLHGIDALKHPLYALVARGTVVLVDALPGVGEKPAVVVTIALLATLNIAAMFALAMHYGHSFLKSLGGATFFGLSFASLVILSVPETYTISMLVITAYLALFRTFSGQMNSARAAGLGLLCGLGGLANPPLLMLGIIPAVHLLQTSAIGVTVRCSIVMLLVSLLVYLGLLMGLWGTAYFTLSAGYADTWASLGNFQKPDIVALAAAQMFAFSIASPLDAAPVIYGLADASGYLSRPHAMIPAVLSCIVALASFVWLLRNQYPQERGIGAWVVTTAIFYVWFNPGEAILYSIQLLPGLILIAQRMHGEIRKPGHLTFLFILWLILMTAANIPACFNTVAPT